MRSLLGKSSYKVRKSAPSETYLQIFRNENPKSLRMKIGKLSDWDFEFLLYNIVKQNLKEEF